MNLTYFIISLVMFLIFLYLTNYVAKTNNKELFYIGIVFMITSIAAAVYCASTNPTDQRTNYPGWEQSTQDVGYPSTVDLWTAASGSNRKPPWVGPLDLVTTSQKDLTKRWIQRTVGTLDENSVTSADEMGIKSILVRRNDGTTADLPIMDFFKKLHDDMVLGFDRAKDYVDQGISSVSNDLASVSATANGGIQRDQHVKLNFPTCGGQLKRYKPDIFSNGNALRCDAQDGDPDRLFVTINNF